MYGKSQNLYVVSHTCCVHNLFDENKWYIKRIFNTTAYQSWIAFQNHDCRQQNNFSIDLYLLNEHDLYLLIFFFTLISLMRESDKYKPPKDNVSKCKQQTRNISLKRQHIYNTIILNKHHSYEISLYGSRRRKYDQGRIQKPNCWGAHLWVPRGGVEESIGVGVFFGAPPEKIKICSKSVASWEF
jgi:hypothetical protein